LSVSEGQWGTWTPLGSNEAAHTPSPYWNSGREKFKQEKMKVHNKIFILKTTHWEDLKSNQKKKKNKGAADATLKQQRS
jgi:hypothetical protein